jgi:hypothetical protein
MSIEDINTTEELKYLQSEADKIDGLEYFNIILKVLNPDKSFIDINGNPLPTPKANLKNEQIKNRAKKSITKIELQVVKEAIYEPKKGVKKSKGYTTLSVFIYKKNTTIDEDLREYLSGVKVLLDMHISTLLQRRLEDFKKAQKSKNKEKKGKFKKAGHLVDQTLKYSYPRDKSNQLPLFDSITKEDTKNLIRDSGVEVSELVEGINLSPSESKVIDSLCKLLHENSQITEPTKEDYYSGNIGYELVPFGGELNTPAPKLGFTLYELTKEYKGEDYVSGKDIENVKQILTNLDNKKFLLSYVETTKIKGGGRIERKIEDFRKLIHILKISETEYNKENIELTKREDIIILLNPIFRRQIDSKFILYPNDINRRTIIAYGSHNISEVTIRLREYLTRELGNKHYKPEIGLDRLYYLLAEKWMKESRKKKVKEYTEKAIETVKALGLLISYEEKKNYLGEPKIVFTLNKNWE